MKDKMLYGLALVCAMAHAGHVNGADPPGAAPPEASPSSAAGRRGPSPGLGPGSRDPRPGPGARPATSGSNLAQASATPPAPENSGEPKPAEWANAVPVALRRVHPNCELHNLREWYRVRCKQGREWEPYLGVRVLAGPVGDIHLGDPPARAKKGRDLAPDMRGVDIVFPLRKGERRLLALSRMLPLAWKSWTVEEAHEVTISAAWLEQDEAPTLTMY